MLFMNIREHLSQATAQRCDSISLDTGRELHQICYGLVTGIIYVLFPNDFNTTKNSRNWGKCDKCC